MNIKFDIGYPAVLILLLILVALGYSLLVYSRKHETEDFSVIQRRILTILRFSGIFACLFLLLNPVFTNHRRIKDKPLVIIAADNSHSMYNWMPQIIGTTDRLRNQLQNKNKLEFWIFGDEPLKKDTVTCTENISDYSSLIKTLNSNYINQSIGAVILLGDGIFNKGANPLNLSSSLTYPIYSIGFGDTTKIRDASIGNIRTNKSVFINNFLPVEVDFKYKKLAGQLAQIEVLHEGKAIYNKSYTITSNIHFNTEFIQVQAKEKGLQKYQIHIKAIDGETNLVNNTAEFAVNVIENKPKILVLSNGLHPDIGMFNSILEESYYYDVTVINKGIVPDNLKDYGLIVLYQLPEPGNFNQAEYNKITASKTPILLFVGEKTSIPYLNNMNIGIQVTQGNGINEGQFFHRNGFSLFKLEDAQIENLSSFPPLNVPNAEFRFSTGIEVLASQKLKGIETNIPMFAFGLNNGRRTGFVFGEGIYRWRNYDFLSTNSHQTINEFIYKITNYLILKEQENNFNLYYSPVYTESDEIRIEAELFNDSYELINQPELMFELRKDNISSYVHIFDKMGDRYSLNLGKLEAGTYSFDAKVKIGNNQLNKTGSFTVSKSNIEEQNTEADFYLLKQLSLATGGQFIQSDKLEILINDINKNKQVKTREFIHLFQEKLIDLKSLFFVILLLLGLEWFLRKLWGIY